MPAHPWDGTTVVDPSLNLDAVIARFPEHSLLIRLLCLSDPRFRSLCEEYGLACMCLARFEGLGGVAHASEIEEYRSLIASLEAEIAQFFLKSA